ncbi:uncharacterized protein B0T15DRAFT_535897 [Chaetomium strumarium]|uniref:Protein transport protein SEC31 n=1 Tax=Chaetomium strumarium TaxID=1170767 RepID=A0AAJ0M0A0_9PEZI|nr:hypothetical protein B0T15DRAFT_535897 [Chaetomium strumarium]
MVRLREIPRTAAFAWSPGTSPFLVTGTRSGAVDADFSDETKLELWDLNLDAVDQGLELQPIASISTESRFYDIAWGAASDEHPRGVVAGAMEDGSLQLWDAAKLLAGEEALMSRDTKHTGPIKALQFNPLRPQVLATAGAKGELFIWDINDTSTAFRLGTAAAHDIDCVAWNRKVSNILATGSAGGFVTVWDLKTKKASLTLNNNRKPVSAIAWDPNNSTNLLTATSDDNTPVILLWNLRNSQAPERTLQGHDQGILSLSWCQQDPGLLISCGKDNRTLVWNPQTGERYGEFPEATNWTFLTRFNPGNPNLMATASFDGKITIQTLQNTNPSAVPAAQTSMDDDDFFSKAPTQLQGASFSLTRAPVWLERPVGVSFGYGGKLVIFRKSDTAAGQPRSSKIQISGFSVDSDIGSATEKFEEAFKNGDIAGICDSHVAEAKTDEEKADWQVLKTLSESDGRTKILEYLGFGKDEGSATEEAGESAKEESKEEPREESNEAGLLAPPQANSVDAAKKKHKRVTSMWGDVDEGDDFLSDLAPAKGAKTDDPFQLLGEGNAAEDGITKAIIMGNFEKAVDICMKEDRIADAFILANCGGKDLVEKVQTAYLAQKKGRPSYLRLVNSIIGKNLWDVVYNADLGNWKETMVTLCTFAEPSEFPDLCEALGDRIYESGSRRDASFCYLVGSKLEKVVDIWIAELQEAEQAGLNEASNDSGFSIHARSLQHFIEKVTVFRHVAKFTDTEKDLAEGWKLVSLYDKYTEYADIVAAQGHLAVAQRYLDLLPNSFPAAEVARNRVRLATQKAAPVSRTPSRAAAPMGYQQPATIPPVGPSPLNPYAPPVQAQAPAPAANRYAPPSTNPYAPSGASAYAPAAGYAPSPPAAGGYGAHQPTFGQPGTQVPPPPRSTGPPPKINKEAGNWNDVPMVTKPPVRRTTPSVAAMTSPFPGQAGLQSPPPVGPYQRSVPTPPPPPPKGSAPPRNVTSPPVGPPPAGQQPVRSASVTSNASTNPYAPPPPPATGLPSPMVPPPAPRTASPYNPPPAAAPPSNRYAPAPSGQPYGPGPTSTPLALPPANPYAPPPAAQPMAPPPQQYAAPPPQAFRPPVGPPPTSAPPPAAGGPPPAARAPPAQTPPPPKAAASAPQAQRHPPGDRSHIPANAKRMVEVLSQDMQRVASKAPATFAPQVKDTQKRLGLLFDHLNNGDLVKPDTIEQLNNIAEAIAGRNYDVASRIQMEIFTHKTEECGQWMTGLKRLISMSKATP